ncbi:hypothetical protein [Flavobacterium sp. CAU 1735]|uniref:hypothetical protein n=1 Tax=Flavobacterium sp. CAU 1735 TaxID=3140361 RepID=UPI00326044F9
MILKLNKDQFDYLNYSLPEEYGALKLKLKHIRKEDQFIIIEIDIETANEIRDWAGHELQKKGFDINYELTFEGKLLEKLIDLFYVE